MLRWAALFLGELRDGLTMINMQSAFLIVSKHYTEKQAGVLFFVFGMSQFLFQTPAGYLFDYTEQKIMWLSSAAIMTTLLTVLTAAFAADYGANLTLMILIKFVQGAVTSFIPPGLNSITQGLVGADGMTTQVATNEMMNHLGTAIIVLTGSLLGVFMYPELGWLFIVSPIACTGVLYFLNRIRPEDIDHAAARGLAPSKKNLSYVTNQHDYQSPSIIEQQAELPPSNASTGTTSKKINTMPSFNFGWQSVASSVWGGVGQRADSPLKVLRDPVLLAFLAIVFLFHLSNGTILPLVMQTLALESGRTGILMSGLCIIVAQIFMVLSAKICGDYSGKYGRKSIFLVGLFSVPVRCMLLFGLIALRDQANSASQILKFVILSTQILDGIGAGVFGTMYILVTSDISGGTGRFSMTLGLTTAAMSIGGTVSGYLGEALAQDLGYQEAFLILGLMSLVPALLYLFVMPETLPALAKQSGGAILGSQIESIAEEEGDAEKPYMEMT